MLRVGLTGGIASGKSHVAARFAARGFRTLDLDRVGHDVIAPSGSAYAEVVSAFGTGVLDADGRIDRKALGRIVFADAAARARLNAIVHPRIRAEEARLLAALSDAAGSVVVIEAALSVETGQHLRFDRLVVADCGEVEQRRRLMRRDGLDDAAAAARLKSQMPAADKRRFAHFVVDTAGTPELSDAAADRVATSLQALAVAGGRRRIDVARGAALAFGGPAVGPGRLGRETLLDEMAGGLELERLARRLRPPPVPWYAPASDAPEGPEAFAGPAGLFGSVRRGDDPEYAAGVAYSLARLTHVSAALLSRAVLFALAAQAAAYDALDPAGPEACALARRFAGQEPDEVTRRAAAAHAAALRSATPAPSADERAALDRLLGRTS